MAVDKLVDSGKLDAALAYEANKIIAKGGGTAPLAFDLANEKGFGDYIDAIPSGGGGNFALIGETVIENVSEWTDTSTWDYIDTGIDALGNDYAFGYVIVTCDSPITTTTEWGMTIAYFGRTYTNHGYVWRFGNGWQIGSQTLSFAAMTHNPSGQTSYGVVLQDNTATFKIGRKCHASACPKIRGGNYTVKVYGMTAI